jgi:two-component system chemotaxis sensor kinase CheA
VLVRAGDRLCAVPAASVERVARVDGAAVRTVENRATILLEGQVLSLVDMADVLALPRPAAGAAAAPWPVLVLGQGAARVAFRVDAILGEQEILLKPLGPQLARVRHVSGASLLGTGEVVPVLNVADLLHSAATGAAPSPAGTPSAAKRKVLVVEDSVTSRALLKSILESDGYVVSTAVDGLEALAELKAADFDLVVSDVEMPRMDGFELTACIRADRQLAELPVVLVTALDSREHRERGVDVGASAYIVKSRFDQGNLLETVGRLL